MEGNGGCRSEEGREVKILMTGRMKYVPKVVIEEIDDLKVEHNLKQDSVAMNKMVNYTRVGRELERMMKFNFKHKPTKIKKRGLF